MKPMLIMLMVMVFCVGSIVLFCECVGKEQTNDKLSGMLEQCQRDFDILLERCNNDGTH